MNELEEGRAIRSITFHPHQKEAEPQRVEVGKDNVKTITVRMQPSQLSLVPWILVRFDEKPPVLVNANALMSIEFELGRSEV